MAVKATDVARPEPFVNAVFTPPAKAADAPPGGTAKVTGMPGTALPLPSFTNTDSGLAKAAFTDAVCEPAPFTVIDVGCWAVIVNKTTPEACCGDVLPSLTWNVSRVAETATEGVPEISPVVGLSVKPVGNKPLVSDQVKGGRPPVDARVCA